MTDHNREELIEKAAKALTGLTDAEWEIATAEGTDHLTGYFEAAERVLAVFEQAHTPTNDEREAARAYADSEHPELYLAPENERLADVAERAFLAGAGFRRTAVQEPSAEPIGRVIVMCARCGLFPVVAGDEINSDIVVCDRCAFTEGRESVQGEPSDADAVLSELAIRLNNEAYGKDDVTWGQVMRRVEGVEMARVALRAAYEEGKKR